MIHETFLTVTEITFGSHPCRMLSVTYNKLWPFHGGNTFPIDRSPCGRGQQKSVYNSGDVKGTITGTVRHHFVSNDVRRHRLISISYISLLLSRQRPRVRVPSSPPFQIRHLQKWRHPGVGTKRYQIGTSLNAENSALRARPLLPPEWRSSASSLGGLASLLPNEKRHHGGLRSALFTGYGLGVGIQCDADR